ncbi:MAG: glycoside hydrolase family 1 protein, partial [Thermomicrobiales bacterium]
AWAVHAPGIADEKLAPQVAHNLLVAHGLATMAMRKVAPRPLQIGIVLNQSTPEALHPEDAEKCEESWRWDFGQWWDPLLKGFYPAGNAAQIFDLQPEDLKIISQKIDYVGINYYFRYVVSNSKFSHPLPGSEYTDLQWEVTPTALRSLLTRISKDYNYPTLYVTENGAAYNDVMASDGHVHDWKRIDYLREHIKQVRLSIEDGAKVMGYFAWSLMDNFEWAEGYSKRFGLLYVDYATQKRTIKDSGLWFARTAKSNCVDFRNFERPQGKRQNSIVPVICAAAIIVGMYAYMFLMRH